MCTFSEIVIGDYNGDNMDDIYCYENGTTSVSVSVIKRKFFAYFWVFFSADTV